MNRSKTLYLKDQKIYFICNGTSTNKVIDSINSYINTKPSFFSSFFSKKTNNIEKVEYEEFPRLENIGIKEASLCKEYIDEKLEIFNNNIKNKYVYTSLDYNSIETALILFSDIPNLIIFPLVSSSDKTNIKTNDKFIDFKNKFGNYEKNNNSEFTNLEKYWNGKKLNNEISNIKHNNSILINWIYTKSQSINKLSSYNKENFQKNMENIITEKYKNSDNISKNIDFNIFVGNDKLILNILNLCNNSPKKINIENTSIWRLTIDIEFKMNYSNTITSKKIIYKNYKKIYPTEFEKVNELSKNKNSEKYSFKYGDKKYLLLNNFGNIPLKYLKTMNFRSNNNKKKEVIKKIIAKTRNDKKNNKNKAIKVIKKTKVIKKEKVTKNANNNVINNYESL
jgi:hypothetical protein